MCGLVVVVVVVAKEEDRRGVVDARALFVTMITTVF